MANSYLGRRTEYERRQKKEAGEEWERGATGERARPAATFQRIIIAISLGALDLVVLFGERKKERKENDGKMWVREPNGEKWAAQNVDKEKSN